MRNSFGVILLLIAVSGCAHSKGARGESEKIVVKEDHSKKIVEGILKKKIRHYPKKYVKKLASHLVDEAERHNISTALVLSVIQTESAFSPKVVSHKGAVGLMQVMPTTAAYIAKRESKIRFRKKRELQNPFVNLRFGIYYLAYLKDRYKGRIEHILSAYNAGPGKVDRILKRNGVYHPQATKGYVEKVTTLTQKFQDLLNEGANRI
ncbi:MAG: hypothetical protein CL678_12260 [Bdellovibrionaceae bacterium]|nr:hypothetical protein [Pseudobdellovibrionaceae bacterium]|tara:strand:+ start:1759 stop:2379 length:621 start_codon:yes stop_codon:yes gene_type:complete